MNQRLLIGIIILAGIGSIGSVMAFSGTISAGQGNFNNVLVTGTCTGCGVSEGSFTSYNVVLNSTIAGTSGNNAENVLVGTDGSILTTDNGGFNAIIFVNGTVKTVWQSNSFTNMNLQSIIAQSQTGKYKTGEDNTNSQIIIYKNNVLLQNRGIKLSDFFGSSFGTVSIGISQDGKYIALYGDDVSGGINRLVILQGS